MAHIPKLKRLRTEAKLSQARLARLADVDRNTVSACENGKVCQEIKCHMIIDGLNIAYYNKLMRPLDPNMYIVDNALDSVQSSNQMEAVSKK